MRIALTGGSGFLGRHLISHFQDPGREMVALTRRDPASMASRPGVTWIRGELNDAESLGALVEGADVVIHSGLFRGGDSFMHPTADPITYWETNATGSLRLLELAHQAGVEKFVFVSSGAVHDCVLDDGRPLDETHPSRPSTLYGAYKSAVESVVHHYGVAGKLWTATVRPPSIYGIAEPIDDSKWYELVRRVCLETSVEAQGGSKTVHADDIARTIAILLQQDQSASGQVFNCCDGMISDYEVAEIAKRLSGSDCEIIGSAKQAKHQIDTRRIEAMGMRFGGRPLLESTVQQMVDSIN